MIELTDRRVNRWIVFGSSCVLITIAVAGGLLFLHGDRGRPKKDLALVQQMAALDTKIKEEDRALAGESTIRIDAAALRKAYDADATRADGTYRNKRLLVSGTVKSVQQEGIYDVVIVLSGPSMFEVVRATAIETEAAKAANLTRGGPVVLLCTGNGRILETPSLTACSIQ